MRFSIGSASNTGDLAMCNKLLDIQRAALILTAIVVLSPITGPIALAQTIYVDTSSDVVDFGGAQQVADLPGPDGRISLPEAALASDNSPGVQTIGFHIPQSDWQFQQFFPGRAVLRPFGGLRLFDTAILDGTTQTAFTGDTYPNGGEVVIWAETYLINNAGGRVIGFDHSSIHLSGGSGNVIQGNTDTGIEVFDSSFNLIGGANSGQGNTGGVIQIDRASDNVVVGNTVQRVRILGWIGNGQPAANNRIGGSSPSERNYIMGLGTLNSESIPNGYAVQLFDSIGTIIENNQIGTTPDGMQPGHAWTTMGIYFDGENHSTTIRNNRIAGIRVHVQTPHGADYFSGSAIVIYGTGSSVSIVGNKIGLNANNQPVLGCVIGIQTANYYIGPVQDVAIGGTAAGDGNEIAGQMSNAITVSNTYTGVRISGNSIHDNGGLGIDLIPDGFQGGVTPNDFLDVDTGGNGLQNFPVLTSADTAGSSTTVQGTLNSMANQTFTLEFFASPACHPSGHGEGRTYLGATTVTTNNAGNISFSAALPVGAPADAAITATATQNDTGNTSEFSACVTVVTVPSPPGDIDGDGDVDLTDQALFVGVLLGMDTNPDHLARADLNADDIADAEDCQPFVIALVRA